MSRNTQTNSLNERMSSYKDQNLSIYMFYIETSSRQGKQCSISCVHFAGHSTLILCTRMNEKYTQKYKIALFCLDFLSLQIGLHFNRKS